MRLKNETQTRGLGKTEKRGVRPKKQEMGHVNVTKTKPESFWRFGTPWSNYRSFRNIKPRCRSHPACSKLFGPPKRQGRFSTIQRTMNISPYRRDKRQHHDRRRRDTDDAVARHDDSVAWKKGLLDQSRVNGRGDEGPGVWCEDRQGGSEGPRRQQFPRFKPSWTP